MCAASKSASCPAANELPGCGLQVAGFFKRGAKALFHFRRRRLGEGDDENFIQRRAFPDNAIETAFNERLGFARARAGHDEHVAARGDRPPLRRRQAVIIFARRFHSDLRLTLNAGCVEIVLSIVNRKS